MRQVCQVNGRWNKLKGVLHLWTSHRLILTCFPITHLCLLYPTGCLKWDLFLETDLGVCRGIRSFHCPKFTSEGECVLNTFFSPIGITDFHLRKRRWEVWSKAQGILLLNTFIKLRMNISCIEILLSFSTLNTQNKCIILLLL